MNILYLILAATTSYLIGSFPTAYVVVKRFAHKNIMKYGTGNVGTMNTHRTTNSKWMTAVVFFTDHLKGILAFAIAYYGSFLMETPTQILLLYTLTFTGAIVGHNYSIWLRFRGGKGLATAAGYFIFFNPWLYVTWVISFFIIVLLTRYMVLSQMIATFILIGFTYRFFPAQFLPVLFPGLLVIIKHAPRMLLVINGQEPTFYFSESRKNRKIAINSKTKSARK